MRPNHGCVRLALLIISLVSVLTGTSLAKKPPKTYPEEGKVIGTGSLEHYVGKFSHIYKVETATTLLVLDCGKVPAMFPGTGDECGGNHKIKIGDVIRFPIEKDWAYIPMMGNAPDDPYDSSNHNTHQEQTEQKLRILSQQLSPDAAAQAPSPASGSTDPNPPEAKH